ncbi:hypothetical protein EGW08_020655 [Elysia chlorotica]|uniref:Uncharacterized protein n=1 Tax=Elysia chlorotica TaxID=188477 RepID=A0A3S1BP91_ELYCH|nr:hypothetical protein EGW08_020655 [Elysia chlorotica]
MERTFWPIAVLCLLVYRCRGIDLDILAQPPDSLVDNWCGLLQCSEQAGGGLVTIDSLTVFKKSSTGADQLVAELSFDYPFIDSEEGSMKIEGSMDAKGVKANIKIELKEQADCEAEFTCKVLGKDGSSGVMVISSTEKGLARGDASASNLAPVRYLGNLISQSVNRLYLVLETKVLSFGERVHEMEELVKGSGRTIDKKLNVSIKQLQDHIDTKIHELERKLPPKSDGKGVQKRESDPQSLSKLESDSKDIQKRESDPQSLSKLQLTISSAFSRFSNEAKANITSHLDTLTFWFRNNQSEILANLSEQSAASLANASDLLQLVNEDFKKREGLDQVVLSTVKTELEAIRDALTTTEIKAVCMLNDTFDSDQNVECYRYMSAYRPIPFPQYIQTHDKLLNQTILCDTKARSGGRAGMP